MKLGKPDVPEVLDSVTFIVVTQLVKNLLPFMQPKVHCCVLNTRAFVTTQSQLDPVHTL